MKTRSMRSLVACAGVLTVWGCSPDIDQDPPPSRNAVRAVFDTATSTIPLPNNAALEPDGTLPDTSGGTMDANGEFLRFNGDLSGFSPLTPIAVPFSGELNPDTLTADTVKLYSVAGDTFTELASVANFVPNSEENVVCDPNVCSGVVVITPAEPLAGGAQYAALLTTGIEDSQGANVIPDQALFLALSNNAIYADEEVLLRNFADDPATAQALEGLRQMLLPIREGIDVDRNDIASLFTWRTVSNPFTILSAATSTLPIPNTLALESDGTFPAAALNFCGDPNVEIPTDMCESPAFQTCSEAADCGTGLNCVGGRCLSTSCAQAEFDSYLDGLHGWPTTTPITLPFTGEIDPTTVNTNTIQLWAQNAEGTFARVDGITVGFDPCGSQIVITPPAEMTLNTNYFAFATREIQSSAGLPLVPANELFLAIQPYDVFATNGTACEAAAIGTACESGGICSPFEVDGEMVTQCGESTIGAVDNPSAFALSRIRPLLRGTTDVIEASTELTYQDLAAVWSWYTWTDTFTTFDPTAGVIPFPHTVLATGCPEERPLCNIPQGEDALSMLLYEELSVRPGFTGTAPHWIPFTGPPVDPTTIEQGVQTNDGVMGNVLFAEADMIPPPLLAEEDWGVRFLEDNIVVDFNRPLKPNTLVAGLVTNSIMGSNGFPVQPSPAFVFLRSTHPLVDDAGVSQVNVLDDATAGALEVSRGDFEQLFLVALIFGYARNEVVNAWAYTTQPVVEPLLELHARVSDELATDGTPMITEMTPNNVTDPGTVADPDDAAVMVDVSNIAEIHWNMEFQTYFYIDANGNLDVSNVQRSPVGISVFVPKAEGGCTAPFDVVIAQHGFTGYRKRIGLSVANDMAADCIATVAMDFALHGGRVAGSTDLHPATIPANSGENFVSPNFVATKNLFHQSVIDLTVLNAAIQGGALDTALGGGVVSTNVAYLGQSLGGFIGSLFVTVEPTVTGAVLNVAGGDFGDLLANSDEFSALLPLESGSFAELQVLHFIQWLGEVADPYAFAPFTIDNPATALVYDSSTDMFTDGTVLPANDVMIQMVVNDTTVPNTGTEKLASAMGVDITDTTYPDGVPHGFLSILDSSSASFNATECARTQAANYLRSVFDGSATIAESATDCLMQ